MYLDTHSIPREIARRGWSVVADVCGGFRLATDGAPSALWALCDSEPPATERHHTTDLLFAILELRRLGRLRAEDEPAVRFAFGAGAVGLVPSNAWVQARELRAGLMRLALTGR